MYFDTNFELFSSLKLNEIAYELQGENVIFVTEKTDSWHQIPNDRQLTSDICSISQWNKWFTQIQIQNEGFWNA